MSDAVGLAAISTRFWRSRRIPTGRTLLRVIAREPDAVSYALAGRMRRWRRGILDDRCW
jgi:hypothetical protein